MTQTLNQEKIEFSQTEKAQVDELIFSLRSEIRDQFDALYESADKVSLDSRWGAYSRWRPYAQSEEYQRLLGFCQGQKQAIWPLLLQRLDAETSYFAGSLIIDLTLPEYLDVLERSAESQIAKPAPVT